MKSPNKIWFRWISPKSVITKLGFMGAIHEYTYHFLKTKIFYNSLRPSVRLERIAFFAC